MGLVIVDRLVLECLVTCTIYTVAQVNPATVIYSLNPRRT